MTASTISFLIIGAQKAGTTSLFEYVRRHPQIYMPGQKEISFFSAEATYAKGWDWYESAFRGAPAGAVCGEASVGYMCGTTDLRGAPNGSAPVQLEAGHEEIVPQRIRRHLPDAKLVCVLRDPVARCQSHYRMAVLAGAERRPLEQAVHEVLQPDALQRARSTITGSNGYVVRGEYFRVLEGFWRMFPPEQLVVLFSSELIAKPAETLTRVYEFIGVDPEFIPDNLGRRYREAAVARWVPGLDLYAWQNRLSHLRPIRRLWHALPSRTSAEITDAYERASFRVEVWNARRGELESDVPPHLREMLISHFRPDSEALASALGRAPPWLADWSSSSSAAAVSVPR
ncbi:MAG: sulfotransferase [Actinobacteria bacterium]|nr:sulfotransferase [Actinomycetota bacterium]